MERENDDLLEPDLEVDLDGLPPDKYDTPDEGDVKPDNLPPPAPVGGE